MLSWILIWDLKGAAKTISSNTEPLRWLSVLPFSFLNPSLNFLVIPPLRRGLKSLVVWVNKKDGDLRARLIKWALPWTRGQGQAAQSIYTQAEEMWASQCWIPILCCPGKFLTDKHSYNFLQPPVGGERTCGPDTLCRSTNVVLIITHCL